MKKLSLFLVPNRQNSTFENALDFSSYVNEAKTHNFNGFLFFEGNSIKSDPWIYAQNLISKDNSMVPIIAINPIYMHPFAVAKKIVCLSNFYKARIGINFISGASVPDLDALGLNMNHDKRYERLDEFIAIVLHLTMQKEPLFFDGEFYKLKGIKLPFTLEDPFFFPDIYIAGASEKAKIVSTKYGIKRIEMGKDIDAENAKCNDVKALHFGIWTQSDEELAWSSFNNYFGKEIDDEKTSNYILKKTDSTWKRELSESNTRIGKCYTLNPFLNLQSDCPYYVGSYKQIAEILSHHISNGCKDFIIEVATSAHIKEVAKIINIMNLNSLSDITF